MIHDVLSLDGIKSGEIDLLSDIFEVDFRSDILNDVVRWQLASRRLGCHSTKTRSEVNRSTKKIGKQKGSGRARHGAASAPIFVGGGRAFGPRPRSYDFRLNKKIKRLALKIALSNALSDKKLTIIDNFSLESRKVKVFADKILNFTASKKNVLFVDQYINDIVSAAASNISFLNVIPVIGLNVLDILKSDHLLLTKSGVKAIEERLLCK